MISIVSRIPTKLFVVLQAVANILLPRRVQCQNSAPCPDAETVVIESSFIMSPMRVVIPTANDACTRMRSGIRIPDFPSRNKRYITHVNEPTDQSKRSAGYAGESMSSFSVVYWSSPTSATNQTSDAQGCEAFHPLLHSFQ